MKFKQNFLIKKDGKFIFEVIVNIDETLCSIILW